MNANSDKELEERILDLLEKNGLNEHSGSVDIQKAKESLQLARDLDGIDASNIIEGRRSRRAASVMRCVELELLH